MLEFRHRAIQNKASETIKGIVDLMKTKKLEYKLAMEAKKKGKKDVHRSS